MILLIFKNIQVFHIWIAQTHFIRRQLLFCDFTIDNWSCIYILCNSIHPFFPLRPNSTNNFFSTSSCQDLFVSSSSLATSSGGGSYPRSWSTTQMTSTTTTLLDLISPCRFRLIGSSKAAKASVMIPYSIFVVELNISLRQVTDAFIHLVSLY